MSEQNAAKLMMELKIEWNNLATLNDCDVFLLSGAKNENNQKQTNHCK